MRHIRPLVIALALVAVVAVLASFGVTRAQQRSSGPAAVMWTGDFETGNFAQWEGLLREGPGSAALIRARGSGPKRDVLQGRYAARFVLEPQTNENGSRIEAHQSRPESTGGAYGAESWYSWAEYVPAASRFAPHAGFNHLVQFHPEAPCSGGSLGVNGLARRPRLVLRMKGGDVLSYDGGCRVRYLRVFDLGVVPRDRWLRFRLHVRWSADPAEGFVEFWMNGVRVVPFTQLATAQPDVGTYLRQGVYRFRCACRTIVYADAMTVWTGTAATG
jgi:Polysaccharide lyase